ncbi:MAG: glycosyltransferase, partial [Acetatifactor sp.]|nr:glycosyltransferase [Acetatifactor sp.]
GNKPAGLKLCGFNTSKPIILVVGGSTGAVKVNNAVRAILPDLLKKYQVVHLCGKGKTDASLNGIDGYIQFEYIKAELKDLFAMADLVISRAGANAICELLALKKPNILIPLPSASSRGDQLLNAKSFEAQGYSILLQEDDITTGLLIQKVQELYENRATYIETMSHSTQMDSIRILMDLIEQASGAKE